MAGATAAAANAQSAPAPTMKVGDRWVYNVKSGIGLQTITYQETREVTAVSGGAFKVKVTESPPTAPISPTSRTFPRPGASLRDVCLTKCAAIRPLCGRWPFR
jgi:hypothetical protein